MAGHDDVRNEIGEAFSVLVDGVEVEDVIAVVKSSPRRKALMRVVEKSVWTGIQTGIAFITIGGFVGDGAEPLVMLMTAGTAAVLSTIKNLARERQAILGK